MRISDWSSDVCSSDLVCVLQRSGFLANIGALAADIGSGEEHGLDQVEIPLFQHPLHEHGTDHTAPTDQTYTFHRNYTYRKSGPRRLRRARDRKSTRLNSSH